MGKDNEVKNHKLFIPEDEEIRDGFRVSINRKKIRNIQIGLLEEVKRICKKYNIKYYSDGGTMLGAVRHKGFIPRDDDLDIGMFREDYELFLKVVGKELPLNMRLRENYSGFSKLINTESTCLTDDNWKDKELYCGINIDIFPIDYSSKLMIYNWIKSKLLRHIKGIIDLKEKSRSDKIVGKRKKPLVPLCKILFKNIRISKLLILYNNINKKTILRGNKVYTPFNTYRFFPVDIYKKSHEEIFENTKICIPNGYDTWLKIAYGDYMKPVIYPGGHHCWYSTDKSYKDIVKTFDKNKSDKENYNNCKDLFVLD